MPGRREVGWISAGAKNWPPLSVTDRVRSGTQAGKEKHMAQGEFAYAMNGNRFLGAPALADQPFALFGIPFDGAVTQW